MNSVFRAAFRAHPTACSIPRVQFHLLPCRSYFRTAFVAAKHREQKAKLPVVNLKLPKTPLPTSTNNTPPLDEPAGQPPEPSFAQDDSKPHSTGKHLLFTGVIILDIFLYAAIKTNTDTDKLVDRITHGQGAEGLDNRTLLQAKLSDLVQKWQRWGDVVAGMVQNLPAIPRNAIAEAYLAAAQKYLTASDGLRVCWGICAVNGAVFVAWQVPRLAIFMTRHFIHHPLSGRFHTLLTSVFSHHGFVHLLFNSMALLSFGAAAGSYLHAQQLRSPSNRLESTTGYHFLAFFVSAGLVSSFASHALRIKMYNRAVALFSKVPSSALQRVNGSLGASGAVYACVAVSAMAYPDAKVSPIFIPIGIPIRVGVGALVLLDVVGLIRGWRFLDHIAHLSGAMYGLWYYLYGPRLWDLWRSSAASMYGG
ncbi:hypothetical protein B0H19DRAFT_1115426 [Mycena capillaripes]|nr:hypothetical protein B0H19DRAFT_1115426 [Mycena capillaripes]